MDTTTETAQKFVDMLIHERPQFTKHPSNLQMEGTMETTTEKLEKYQVFNVQRQQILKHPTNLHLEGKMVTQTEQQEKYIPFNIEARPTLMKRSTTLHLEGEIQKQTENREKYIPFDSQRQPLMKRSTNLHLEGIMDILSEHHLKYVPKEGRRPPLAKRDTNLHLEGDLILAPEYKSSFIGHPAEIIRRFRRPSNNLGSEFGSDRDESPEKIFKTSGTMIPLYKEQYVPHNIEKSSVIKPKENLKPEGNFYFLYLLEFKINRCDQHINDRLNVFINFLR